MYTTYFGRNVAKTAGSFVISGSDDALSAATAEMKVDMLGDVLQIYFQARDSTFDGTDINEDDCLKAILYARSKKHTKAMRRGAAGTAKAGLQIAAVAGGVTVGSVVPGLGNALGAVGGAVAGSALSPLVTGFDLLGRLGKGLYKRAIGTRGHHRGQAANALMHCAKPGHRLRAPAITALLILLGDEYDEVMSKGDAERLADRLKSN